VSATGAASDDGGGALGGATGAGEGGAAGGDMTVGGAIRTKSRAMSTFQSLAAAAVGASGLC